MTTISQIREDKTVKDIQKEKLLEQIIQNRIERLENKIDIISKDVITCIEQRSFDMANTKTQRIISYRDKIIELQEKRNQI